MKHLYKRFFPTVFATALVISSVPVYPSAAQADTSSDNLKILTRVYDTTNDSLLHYHYEDTNGNVVSLNDNTATTSSSKKKATALPSSYDLRTQNAVTSIKDQRSHRKLLDIWSNQSFRIQPDHARTGKC